MHACKNPGLSLNFKASLSSGTEASELPGSESPTDAVELWLTPKSIKKSPTFDFY